MTESVAGAPDTLPSEPAGQIEWDLTRLLRPASIAVVGATDRPGTYGAQTLLNLEALG